MKPSPRLNQSRALTLTLCSQDDLFHKHKELERCEADLVDQVRRRSEEKDRTAHRD